MNDKIKRFTFYNIFFLCAFCSLFIVLGLRSFASTNYDISAMNGRPGDPSGSVHTITQLIFSDNNDGRRFGILFNRTGYAFDGTPTGVYFLYSNMGGNFNATVYYYTYNSDGSLRGSSSNLQSVQFTYNNDLNIYKANFDFYNNSLSGLYVFTEMEDLQNYLIDGIIPELPFDNELQLDSLKVTSWQLGTSQIWFKSRFEVTWSDPNITLVQVIIDGTAKRDSFESSVTPFKQKFEPNTYVMKKGDVIHITATPYRSDGSYGVSLYQSFIFDDNIPGSNIYRKFTNTPYSDNTLTIPYTGVSGQPESITAPVDGITTNNTYKVNYNPVTYEYGDLNLYEVYYSPVIVYPSDTPTDEIDETQDIINNTYTTNNYYETTKNINIDFDVSFGDISGSDIQHGFDDFGNFSNGFGGFVAKLSSWVLALFPFLSPVVSIAIVFIFGLIVLLAVIALVLKIASVIADLIPF